MITRVTPRLKSLWFAPAPRLTLPPVALGVKSTGPPIRTLEMEAGMVNIIEDFMVMGLDVAVLLGSATAVA